MFDKEHGVPSMAIVGKSPQVIGALAGLKIPEDRKLLMVPLDSTTGEDWMSHEKLSPVLGWYVAENRDEAIQAASAQLEFGGAGHSAAVFTEERERGGGVCAEGERQPRDVESAFGARHHRRAVQHAGSVADAGLRRKGGNITSENVGYKNLLNIKRLARRRA